MSYLLAVNPFFNQYHSKQTKPRFGLVTNTGTHLLDARDVTRETRWDAFVQELGEAFVKDGYIALTGHDLQQLANVYYEQAKAVFDLPLNTLKQMEFFDQAVSRGFVPLNNPDADHDNPQRKGHTSDHETFEWISGTQDNIYPNAVPGFKPASIDFLKGNQAIASIIIKGLVDYIERNAQNGPEAAERLIRMTTTQSPSHILLTWNYPAYSKEGDDSEDIINAPHIDSNLITILPKGTQPGLKIARHDNPDTYLPGFDKSLPPNAILIMSGSLLSKITDGLVDNEGRSLKMKGLKHVVQVPPGTPRRISAPFFYHLAPFEEVVRLVDGVSIKPELPAGANVDKEMPSTGLGHSYRTNAELWRDGIPCDRFIETYPQIREILTERVGRERLPATVAFA